MTDMENQLTVIDGNDVFTIEEQDTLNQEIDRIISAHKNNRQEINRLVFECTAALTEAEDASRKLENKGFFRRLIGGITGSNKRLQDKINCNMRAAQYASQVTLQKLAEQNLMTFDLLTAVNNKLNALLEATNEMFKTQFMMMGKFFLKNRRAVVSLNLRLNAVEKNVKLLNWQNSIEYLDFDGVEYSALDEPAKIVCLTRDFYELTGGKWSTSDLLLLKAAMGQIGINPHQKINYFQTMKTIAATPVLQQKLLGDQILKPISDPSYLISLGTLEKLDALDNREQYLVDGTVDILQEHGMDVDSENVKSILVKKYMAQCADVDLDTAVEVYDFLLDLLFNLETGKEENLIQPRDYDAAMLQPGDDEGQYVRRLFLNCRIEEAIPILERRIETGEKEAAYMMALISLKGIHRATNVNIGLGFLEKEMKVNSAAYVKATYYHWKNECENEYPYKEKLICEAEAGNVFAQWQLALYYCNLGVIPQEKVDKADYNQAIYWFNQSLLQGYFLGYHSMGFRYYNGQGVVKDYSKAKSYLQVAANMGYGDAWRMLGRMYREGDENLPKNQEKAVDCFKKCYELNEDTPINLIGLYYSNSDNHEMAIHWWKIGYEKKDFSCAGNLGWTYRYGKGVAQNYVKAVEYYKQAIEWNPNDDYALKNLGDMYRNGYGVEQSLSIAKTYYCKSAELGNEDAKKALKEIG